MKGNNTARKESRKVSVSVPKKTAPKTERLEARVSPEAKALCQKAASIQGRKLTDFVVHSAVEAATRTVREHELMELSRQDRIAFVEALLNPPAPNARLQQAMRRHDQLVEH